MARYILKRVIQAIPLLLIISIICFTFIKLAPYNAIDAMATPNMPEETVNLIKAKYGFDKPAYVQYFLWLKGILNGQFGYSIVNHESIANDLAARIPATMALVLPSYLLAVVMSIVLGLLAGANKNKFIDKVIDGFCSIGIAVPTFWFAMIIIFIFGYKLAIFPILGMNTIGEEDSFSDLLVHFIMPCFVLTTAFLPELVRYVRSSTIGQVSQNYVTVQDAFGGSTREILFKHVCKNVLLPIITRIGIALPMLVTGGMITETVFGWPGVGPYFITAIKGMDYPVIMAILILSSSLVILGNLLSDILYSLVDPRIRGMR
ncbi:ABC transporter permease [Clostridium beijerinckii]|uniref:ABC transporter permease n=1 Tax=Clostridium beijerinckii TaxID=1520 RepID=UPI00098C4539|nr:ABC transporter permease [Clostridium beijerinckii]NRT75698.1 peptide/nickel transport system permease protein [Clostridium beijerinckii]OOM44661.1 glutathione transport system permease protein GsiC [Clostridium beijerinckii]